MLKCQRPASSVFSIAPPRRRDRRRRGHLKDDHRMGRNYLAHSSGDAINAVLAAVG